MKKLTIKIIHIFILFCQEIKIGKQLIQYELIFKILLILILLLFLPFITIILIIVFLIYILIYRKYMINSVKLVIFRLCLIFQRNHFKQRKQQIVPI